jgi:hypothetical protein
MMQSLSIYVPDVLDPHTVAMLERLAAKYGQSLEQIISDAIHR